MKRRSFLKGAIGAALLPVLPKVAKAELDPIVSGQFGIIKIENRRSKGIDVSVHVENTVLNVLDNIYEQNYQTYNKRVPPYRSCPNPDMCAPVSEQSYIKVIVDRKIIFTGSPIWDAKKDTFKSVYVR